MATAKTQMTADELYALPDDGYRYELLWGELHRMAPPDGDHAESTTDVAVALSAHVKPRGLGTVLSGDPGFLVQRDPDLVLAPDVAFFRVGRLPPRGQRRGYHPFVPDLVVEIVSPNDRPGQVQEMVDRWRAFGVPLVWVFNARAKTVAAHAADGSVRVHGEHDVLDGGEVLPDLRLPLVEFFPD